MLEELEKKFHKEIPMTKMMGLKLVSRDNKELITKIPLDININDKGTAFGGSSNSLSIISGWFVCTIIANELNMPNNKIAIIKNQSSFRAPITKDLECHTLFPPKEEIERIKNKLLTKKSSSVKIKSQIIEEGKVCLDFEGVYVIKV